MFLFSVLLLYACFCAAAATTLLSNSKVLICGAGPVGLCTALLFSKSGCTDITIVEKREKHIPFESEKAYQYLLDGRGQRLTNLLGITPDLAANAVSSFLFTNLTEITTSGEQNTKSLPVDKKAVEKYWLPRSTMLSVLQEALLATNPNVKLLYGTSLTQLYFDAQEDNIVASLASRNNVDVEKKEEIITRLSGFSLVIGADGINSKVRQYLAEATPEGIDGKFEPRLLQSDSSGLKYKMLTPKLRFPLPDSSASVPERAYAIRGISPRLIFSPFARLSLGLLPVRGDSFRTANIITKPGHPLFALKTGIEVEQYLQQTFPQLSPLSDFVGDDELERFAKAEAGTFPQPQYLQSFFLSLSNNTHVALAGDALHAFPPDLGQGVNSGFEDVHALGLALENGSSKSLGEALVVYEQTRKPEVAALCELMVFGFPYQYRQAPFKGMLALANFALRLGLNKLLPSAFAPPAFFLVQDASISMVEIVRRAHDTTRKLYGLLFAVIATFDFVAGIRGGGLLAAATRPNWVAKMFTFCYLNLALLIAYPRTNKF